MSNTPIKNISARWILDSRGNPTVEVTVEAGTARGIFGVPSGASTGSHEALELRDGGKAFGGLGVTQAVKNVNTVIAKNIRGMNVFDQEKIDRVLIELDGTANKSKLGANAILGVSGAVCKAAAAVKKVPIYKYVALLHKNKNGWRIPKPIMVFIEGGRHSDSNLNMQEFSIVPKRDSIIEGLRVASEVFQSLGKVLKAKKLGSNIGFEGAYSVHVESNRQALDLIAEGVKAAGYALGKDIDIVLDVAASEFYQPDDQQYVLAADHTSLSSERLTSLLKEWVSAYSIIGIEDGLAQDDWDGWMAMQQRLGDGIMIIGDDLFVTQKQRLQKGIDEHVGNAIIIKPNQVGTITETLETVKLAQANQYKIVVSHRGDETNDDFLADFAVGVGAEYIKSGSVDRGERVAKYNRLMEIEEEIK